MQPLPIRLLQSTRIVFTSSRPLVRRTQPFLPSKSAQRPTLRQQQCFRRYYVAQARAYSTTERDPKREGEGDGKESTRKEAEKILQGSKDAAASKPSAELTRSRSPEPPLTDPNLDAASPSPSSSSSSGSSNSSLDSLPSRAHSRRTELSKGFSHLMDNVQSNIFVASQRLNDLTGYSGIEALKKEIEAQEAKVQAARAAVREARATYSSAVATRSTTQREVNDLLQRKHAWSPADLERFTALYRSDHANEQAEAAAQEALGRTEREAEEASARLARTILARYHEEQIWSDKIRQMSTWGTWGLMGLNVLLFIVFQIAIEPWRRRRLVKGFEEKVMEALEREGGIGVGGAAGVVAVRDSMDQVRSTMKATRGQSPVPAAAPPTETEQDAVEAAIDVVADAEMASQAPASAAEEKVAQAQESTPVNELDLLPTTTGGQAESAEPASGFAYYEAAFRELFSEKKLLTVTQKELTTVAIEGAAGGAAVMGLLLVLLRPK